MSGSGRKDIPDVREWLGGPHGSPGVVGRPSQMSESGRRPFRMFESGREALPYVRE